MPLFQAVNQMRLAPIGKSALMAIVLPVLIPMLIVLATKVPIRQILGKLLHAVA